LEKPKFEVRKNFISVMLPKVNYEKKDALDYRTKEILLFLKEQPRSRSEIQEVLSLGETKTNEYLNLLQDLGAIKKIGDGWLPNIYCPKFPSNGFTLGFVERGVLRRIRSRGKPIAIGRKL